MSVAFAVCVTFALLVYVPKATTAGDPEQYITYFPGAQASNFYRSSPVPTAPETAYEVQELLDSYHLTIDYPSDAVYVLLTEDFKNYSCEYGPYQESMIPENATIDEVWAIAYFSLYTPNMSFRVTVNGTTHSQYFPAAGDGPVLWNVTGYDNWNHTLLTSANTRFILYMWTDGGIYYHIDYLGFWKIKWTGWPGEGGEGEGDQEDEDPPSGDGADLDYDIIYGDGLVGVMGLIGFCGMIAVPAGSIVIYRNDPSVGRINLFVKMLILWVFCLSLFMLSVNSG